MNKIIRVVICLLGTLSVTLTSASNPDCDKFIKALVKFEKYSDTQWSDYPSIPQSGYWGSGFSGEREGLKPGFTPNDGIRSMNGVAIANAVLIMANPQNPLNAKRLDKVEKVLRYASFTHKESGTDNKCVDGYQWGLGWQTNMWAGSMGFACALLEDQLPVELVAQVKKVVAAEADFRSTLPPGSDYIGNTIAEENAWNSNIVSLAAAWMSDDPRAEKWMETAKIYLVNTYSVDADKQGEMAQWSSTINLYPSYMLENHGFYHPGYHSVSGSSMGDSYLMATLTNKAVSKELTPFLEHNVLEVWDKVKNVVKDNSELFFPCGQDWSLHGYGHVAYTSYLATHFKQPEAVDMQHHLIDLLLNRQDLFDTGEFIGKSNENTFYVEAVTARRIALAWLHNYVNDFEVVQAKKLSNFSNHADDVKIITSRSDKGNVSLSYGRRILLAVESAAGSTPQSQYVFCADNLALIGETPFGQVISAELEECELMDDGFTTSLTLKAKYGELECGIYARAGVVAIIQKPLGESLERAKFNSFRFGIENYIMNGSQRDIYSCSGKEKIAEASGIEHTLGGRFNISNVYGVIYGPEAQATYISPEAYNRRGASVDNIASSLSSPFEPSYAIILCNQDWAATQEVAQSVSFSTDESISTLSFITPQGDEIVVKR